MKRRLIHAGILAAVFVVAVIVFSYVTNRGNSRPGERHFALCVLCLSGI